MTKAVSAAQASSIGSWTASFGVEAVVGCLRTRGEGEVGRLAGCCRRRWTVGADGISTVAVTGGAVCRCGGCFVGVGLAAGFLTALGCLLVGFSRSCSSSVISIRTFRLPPDRFHNDFPVKANPAKACCNVEGNSKLAAIVGSFFLLRRSVLTSGVQPFIVQVGL